MLLSEIADVVGLLDEEGRPLGEVKSFVAGQHAVAMSTARCPYAGSRKGHPLPMNTSALKQVSAHWRTLLDGLRAIRGLVVGASARPATDVELWRMAHLGERLPAFLQSSGLQGPVPAAVAGIFKVCAGLRFSLERRVVAAALGRGELHKVSTPQELLDYAEAEGHLIGDQQVCAGSARQILEVLAALHSGPSEELSATALASMARAEVARWIELSQLLGDFEMWKWTFAALRARIVHDLVHSTCAYARAHDDEAAVEWGRAVFALERDMNRASVDLGGAKPTLAELQCHAPALLQSQGWRRPVGLAPRPGWRGQQGGAMKIELFVENLGASYLALEAAYLDGVAALERALRELLGRPVRADVVDVHPTRLVGTRMRDFFANALRPAARVVTNSTSATSSVDDVENLEIAIADYSETMKS